MRAYQFHGDTSLLTPTNLDIEIDPRAACRHSQSCLGFSLTGTHRPFFEDAMMSLFDAMSEFACSQGNAVVGLLLLRSEEAEILFRSLSCGVLRKFMKVLQPT